MGNLIVGFGSAASDETGGGGAGTANAGGSGDKLEQIERDVLIAPSAIAWATGRGSMEIPLKWMLSKAESAGRFLLCRGNAEADPAHQQIGGNLLRGQLYEVDWERKRTGPKHEAAGLKSDVAKK